MTQKEMVGDRDREREREKERVRPRMRSMPSFPNADAHLHICVHIPRDTGTDNVNTQRHHTTSTHTKRY